MKSEKHWKRALLSLCLAIALQATMLVLATAIPTHANDAFGKAGQKNAVPNLPGLTSFSDMERAPPISADARSVHCNALLVSGGPVMQSGVSWHIFAAIPGPDGKLRLIASSRGGPHVFKLPPGDYFLNAAFGRATATKRLHVPAKGEVAEQQLVLDAGGLILRAVSGADTKIPDKELKFSIYTSNIQSDGERGLVLKDVSPNTVVRLNSGTYHVVSTYGHLNAVIRADIQIAAGKLTEATIQHRAARVTFKLVSTPGGEAIADTAWSILTAAGDVISENVGAFASMVLAEGNYTAIARNKDKIYQKDFEVKAGVNTEVELLVGRDDADQNQTTDQSDNMDAAD